MINGYIKLKDNTMIAVTDENLVNNSLSVQMSVCRNTAYALGTFNASIMKIGIIDEEALDHEFADAKIVLQKKQTEDDEPVYLGQFYVDGTKTKRHKNFVTLTAQDGSAVFDTELPDSMRETEYTPYSAILAACNAVGIALYTADLTGFPNTSVTFTAASAAVQTYRDLVMWACQLLAAHAVLNRLGALEIRHARYTSETADMINEGSDRVKTEFSDTRIYVKSMTAYSAGAIKTYLNTATISDDQARPGTLSLAWNPLLDGKDETECDTINAAILGDISHFLQRQITAKIFDDPSVALDMSMRFRGASIDVRRSIVGLVTAVTWKYHGLTVINCAAPTALKGDEST